LPKIVTTLAVIFGIALGTCGLMVILPESVGGQYRMWVGIVSLATLILSVLGLIVTVLIWIIALAIGSASSKRSDPQTLFRNSRRDSNDVDESS